MSLRRLLLATLPLLLTACVTTGTGNNAAAASPAPADSANHAGAATAEPPRVSPYAPAQEDPSKRGDYVAGGLFRPGEADSVPAEIPDVDAIPEPEVREEPRARTGNRDYVVLGRRYRVMDDAEGYVEEGNASYYGKKFHGRRTSSSEVYDMYAFTAAHRTLPLPSYVRVTNLANGRSIIVRVNDRGPFHSDRIIDLSYAAAVKLGYRERGTARVRVEALTPEDMNAGVASRRPAALSTPTPAPTPAPTAMDRLVSGLPIVAAADSVPRVETVVPAALSAAPATAPAAMQVAARSSISGNRFYMQQGGHNMTAAEFDAWMRARGIRVATGRPVTTPAALHAATTTPAAAEVPVPPPAASVIANTAPVVALQTSALVPDASASDVGPNAVVLQVASFSSEENAKHALAVLLRAAVTRARILVADVGGRQVWRLRIGPVDPEAAPELVSRVEGLGLGRPQRVTD